MTGHNDGRASDQGRVYQASGDQHIVEHHHHGAAWTGPDSIRHPPIGRAPAILRDRSELVGRLREAVSEGAGNTVFVLHGLGGCGKTAVACALFDHATRELGRVGLWVNASDQASLRGGMLAVAADRGARDGELMAARNGLRAAADLVWNYLDRSDLPWLLVLDNADDPAVLRDGGWVRTSPRGIVLVTTRQAAGHWWPAAELLHVGVLPRAEAAQVLCDLAPGAGSDADAAAVADRLGRLPLALTLAGGFLAHQVIAPWTMEEYGRRLRDLADPIELIDQGAPGGGNDSRHLVSGTWQLSLDSLTAQNLPEAVTLLRLLACWSNDPLPLSLLADARLDLPLPAERVELALRGLLDRSRGDALTEEVAQRLAVLMHLLDRQSSVGDVMRVVEADAAGELPLVVIEHLVHHRGTEDDDLRQRSARLVAAERVLAEHAGPLSVLRLQTQQVQFPLEVRGEGLLHAADAVECEPASADAPEVRLVMPPLSLKQGKSLSPVPAVERFPALHPGFLEGLLAFELPESLRTAIPEVAAEVLHVVVEFETPSGAVRLWATHRGGPPSPRRPSGGG